MNTLINTSLMRDNNNSKNVIYIKPLEEEMATQSRILIWIIPRACRAQRGPLGHGLATEQSAAHGPQYLKENRKRDLQENCPDLVLTQCRVISSSLHTPTASRIYFLLVVLFFFSTTYTYHTSLRALFGLKLHLPPSSSHWQR